LSDKKDLIVRSTGIVPADDFAKRVEEELRKRGEEPAQRGESRECVYAFKFEENVIVRCALKSEHSDNHQNGMVYWRQRCLSTAQGEQCRYQRDHVGSHTDVREEMTWSANTPAEIAKDDDNYTGDDILAAIGAAASSPLFQQAFADTIMRQVPLKKTRSWALSFGPEAVPAGGRITITQRLQMLFRGEKIINTGDVDGLYIENIFVGARMQMPNNGGAISVGAFDNRSLSSELRMDTAQPGFDIAIAVRNAATDPRTFAVSIVGKTVV